MDAMKRYTDEMKTMNIDIIDIPGTPKEICASIMHYWETECLPENKTIVCEIDHALLIQGDSDKAKIDELVNGLLFIKKVIDERGGSFIFIVLSQLNRDISSVDRIVRKENNKPMTKDIFQSSTIEFACDYIMVIHVPFFLNLYEYGVENLPTFYVENFNKVGICYLEVLKNRSGERMKTIPLYNNMKYYALDEMAASVFDKYKVSYSVENYKKP
jgi:hypothetical protein